MAGEKDAFVLVDTKLWSGQYKGGGFIYARRRNRGKG